MSLPSHHVPADRSLADRSCAENASPAAIRAALLSEDSERFDEAYRRALGQATRDHDMTPIHATLQSWRQQVIAQSDPDAFRVMVRRAAGFFSGQPVPDDEPVRRAPTGLPVQLGRGLRAPAARGRPAYSRRWR